MNYRTRMVEKDSKKVLWGNVSRLMVLRYGKENLTRLSADAGIGPGTCTRIKEQATSVGTDVIEAVAKALKVEPWQLLQPGFDSPAQQQPAAQEPAAAYVAVTPAQAIEVLARSIQAMPVPDRETAATLLSGLARNPEGQWSEWLLALIQRNTPQTRESVNPDRAGIPDSKVIPDNQRKADDVSENIQFGPALTAAFSFGKGNNDGRSSEPAAKKRGGGSS